MTDLDRIKEYLTDKYNEFNDVDDTKSMEIVADVYYFVEELEGEDEINAQVKQQFMNIVTEHMAEKSLKGLDKDIWPRYITQVFAFRPMTQLLQKRRYRVVLELDILDDSHPEDFNWESMLDIQGDESVRLMDVSEETYDIEW